MNRRIGNGCPSIFSLPKPTGEFWKMAQKRLPMKLTTHLSNHTTTICSPLSPLLSLKFFSPHKRKIHQRHSLKAFVGAAKRLTQNLFAVNPFRVCSEREGEAPAEPKISVIRQIGSSGE
jgi:hypothetical protein